MRASCAGRVCTGALLTSAVFTLQLSCVFFPVLGPLLSAACLLFAAAAGILLERQAILVYLSAALLTFAVSPRYALEFLLTTGYAGLMLGLYRNRPAFSLLVSGFGMFSGLCGLMYLLGRAAFGGLFAGLPVCACFPVLAVFSAAYVIPGQRIIRHLMKKSVHWLRFQN